MLVQQEQIILVVFLPPKLVKQPKWSWGSSSTDDKHVRVVQGSTGILCSVHLLATSGPRECWGPLRSVVWLSAHHKVLWASAAQRSDKHWTASGARKWKGELLPAAADLVQPMSAGPKCVTHDIFNENTSFSVCSLFSFCLSFFYHCISNGSRSLQLH